MIDDALQLEYLKTLPNLRVLNAENNEIIDINIHEKILSNNIPTKSIINQTFIKTENLQVIKCLYLIKKITWFINNTLINTVLN